MEDVGPNFQKTISLVKFWFALIHYPSQESCAVADVPVSKTVGPLLTAEQFHLLAAVPEAMELFANIDNWRSRRA